MKGRTIIGEIATIAGMGFLSLLKLDLALIISIVYDFYIFGNYYWFGNFPDTFELMFLIVFTVKASVRRTSKSIF